MLPLLLPPPWTTATTLGPVCLRSRFLVIKAWWPVVASISSYSTSLILSTCHSFSLFLFVCLSRVEHYSFLLRFPSFFSCSCYCPTLSSFVCSQRVEVCTVLQFERGLVENSQHSALSHARYWRRWRRFLLIFPVVIRFEWAAVESAHKVGAMDERSNGRMKRWKRNLGIYPQLVEHSHELVCTHSEEEHIVKEEIRLQQGVRQMTMKVILLSEGVVFVG